jgi:outer membrane protein assembly factor BamB
VPAPTELALVGTTLYVGSIEQGVYAIDLRTARRQLVVSMPEVHGLAVAGGRLYAATGDRIAQVDLPAGTVSAILAVDAGKPVVGADGTLYFTQGGPNGGTVQRLDADGSTTTVVGNGGIGPDRDAVAATSVGMLIGDVSFARDGSLLVAQVRPRPAKIRRVDLRSGLITTVVKSR